MSERDQAGFPPPGPPKRTVYTAGKVPGVHYVDGVAHSPPDPRPVAPPPPPPPPPQRPIRPPAARRPPAGPPRDTRPAKERRARPLRWIGGIFVILLVGLLVLGWLVWARIDKVDAIPDDHGSAVSEGQVYLLVGSDSREDLSDDERSDLGTGSVSGQRTDTIMLLYVPTSGRRALISIPRDSLVDIPGHDRQRINAAFAYGGPRLLVETIEQNTGVAIDDYVQIGLGGFAGMVDALGGVDVCLDEAIQDDKAHIDLPAGCQTLNGPDALGYARARYFDPRGDIGRVERQQEVLGAIASKTMSPGTLLNPVKLTRVGLAGGDALTVDDGSNPISVARFAWTLMRVTGGGGDKLTVPLGDVGNTVSWHSEDAPRLWAALQAGEEVPPDLVRQE